jgi:hypothetical protein
MQAARADCAFDKIVDATPLLQQGYVDATARFIGGTSAEAKKLQQSFPYAKRVLLHQPTQTMITYGWREIGETVEANTGFVSNYMNRMQKEAEKHGLGFKSGNISDQPFSAEYRTDYPTGDWPQREIGLEVFLPPHCQLSVKAAGIVQLVSTADQQLINSYRAEFTRLRDEVKALPPGHSIVDVLTLRELPPSDTNNFWRFSLPTLLLAVIAGIIIGRAAHVRENDHTAHYFRLMTLLWVLYTLGISVLSQWFLPAGYPISLEHYIYAAIMLIVNILGLILGSVMLLPSVALTMGHILRSTIFSALGLNSAPRIIWFDVGILLLCVLYALYFSFGRSGTLPRPKGSVPNVVDRRRKL